MERPQAAVRLRVHRVRRGGAADPRGGRREVLQLPQEPRADPGARPVVEHPAQRHAPGRGRQRPRPGPPEALPPDEHRAAAAPRRRVRRRHRPPAGHHGGRHVAPDPAGAGGGRGRPSGGGTRPRPRRVPRDGPHARRPQGAGRPPRRRRRARPAGGQRLPGAGAARPGVRAQLPGLRGEVGDVQQEQFQHADRLQPGRVDGQPAAGDDRLAGRVGRRQQPATESGGCVGRRREAGHRVRREAGRRRARPAERPPAEQPEGVRPPAGRAAGEAVGGGQRGRAGPPDRADRGRPRSSSPTSFPTPRSGQTRRR